MPERHIYEKAIVQGCLLSLAQLYKVKFGIFSQHGIISCLLGIIMFDVHLPLCSPPVNVLCRPLVKVKHNHYPMDDELYTQFDIANPALAMRLF